MICYFQARLKPSIKVGIKQQNWESANFEKIIQRTVNAEAKAGLRSSTIVRDLDAHCLKGHRTSYITLVKV